MLAACAFLFFFLLFFAPAHAALGNTRTINFQGRVVNKSDGTNVTDGTYSFTFKLYDAASSGNLLWQETQSSVTVTSGIFNVQLGSSTAFNANPYNVNFNTSPLYLDITFNSETFGTRVQLGTVPYALNAETLDGVIATSSATGFTITGGQSTPDTLTVNGGLTLGSTIQPTAAGGLTVQSNGANALGLDAGGGAAINIGGTNATSIVIGRGSAETIAFTLGSDATGDLFYRNSGGTLSRLAVGTGSQCLVGGTTPGWGSCSAGSSVTLNNVTAAGGTATIANGDNPITWNWAPTTAGRTDFTFGLTAAPASGTNTALALSLTHTSNTETNGLLVNVNGSGGTTTNGLQISQSAGTLTNGLTFSGTIGTEINLGTIASGSTGISGTLANTTSASATGISWTTGSITTSGTQNAESITLGSAGIGTTANGITIAASSNTTGAGTTNAINIAGLTTNGGTSTAINIGSGWSNAISAAGNILIESKTNSAATSQNTWTVKNATAGTLASTPVIASISASAVYNGSLYVGTYNFGKAELYRYNGASAGTFTAINTTAGTIASQTSIDSVSSMAVYNGYLYIGTSKVNGGSGQAEVYRYDGGNMLTLVTGGNGSIGGFAAQASVSAMTVWNGDLYAGTCKSGAGEVFKYQGGTTWIAVSGAGTLATTANIDCVNSLISYNNYLIAGSKRTATAEVYRYTGGTGWIRLNPTAGTFTTTSSGGTSASSVDAVTSMVVYNGHLVVGLRENAKGDVVEYDDNATALAPVNDWSRLNNAAGTIASGDVTMNAVSALAVYNGMLYVGTESGNSVGAEIWQYNQGEVGATTSNWTKVSQNAAGIIGSGSGATSNISMVSQLIQYNNDLWAGTYKTGAAELYTLTNVGGQSYALKFHAAASQAEQNSLENLGTISFTASPSANMGNGGFVFSNGIVTNAGAYDVAEDYPTRDQLMHPGDLVSIDTAEKGMVKRSSNANSTTVIGVYSANPGFDLSQTGNTIDGVPAIPVALTGRVEVNVSSESGQIQSGDYITSSSIPGVGMKAVSAGPVIGQALESFDPSICHPEQSEGSKSINRDSSSSAQNDNTCVEKILVFVSHGYFNGISQQDLAGLSGSGDLSAVQFISEEPKGSNGTNEPNGNGIASGSVILSATKDLDSSSSAQNDNTGLVSVNSLSVNGLATVSADLRVQHNALVEGILSVVDTIMANNFIANGLSEFFGNVVFHSAVAFQNPPTFSPDTAGYVVVKKGTDHVDIAFTKAYTAIPVASTTIVSLTPSDDPRTTIFANGYSYVITKVTMNGFTIALNKQAASDVTFSWNAILVNPSATPPISSSTLTNVAGVADISTAPTASNSGR